MLCVQGGNIISRTRAIFFVMFEDYLFIYQSREEFVPVLCIFFFIFHSLQLFSLLSVVNSFIFVML